MQEVMLYLGQIALLVLVKCIEAHGMNERAIW